ncbi:MAG TPA: arginine--tRNA ligase [Actinomycetota bacterium]|nr:arginine--tRNA ligase [Actinomycetota bacterium]
MIQDTLTRLLADAASSAASDLGLDRAEIPVPELLKPRLKEHGDWSTNIALMLAPRVGRKPREVAESVAARVPTDDLVLRVEVAGPGFINLFLSDRWLHDLLPEILERGPDYGRGQPNGKRVQVEFVSANPTGPLHVGTARNAALGDSLATVLEAAGYEVEREYYWNDTGTQMELLGASLEARYLELFGVEAEVPEGGYRGAYLLDLAEHIKDAVGDRLVQEDPAERRHVLMEEGRRRMFEAIMQTLARFGVRFDTFKTEAELVESGEVADAVERLRQAGYAYDADGAVWFRSTDFGDDKDRVLIRRTGEPTYFAKDCAYLLDKASRGFDRMVYVWGADHHGDVKRILGAAEVLGIDPSRVQIVLYQLVSLYRGGEPVRMRKRTGDIITLDELLDEVGPDAARYTLLTRSHDSALDFDIELVKRQSMDNPVYYVQYAHARVASLLRVAAEQGVALRPWKEADFALLEHQAELDLLRKLGELPEVVGTAAEALVPNRLTRYAEDAAAAFHHFYTECRVITDDDDLTQARLWLSTATKYVIATALRLIGATAPESMERIGGDAP